MVFRWSVPILSKRGDLRKKIKNHKFWNAFVFPPLRESFEKQLKIVPNALLHQLARQIAFEMRSFQASDLKMVPEASWDALGRS